MKHTGLCIGGPKDGQVLSASGAAVSLPVMGDIPAPMVIKQEVHDNYTLNYPLYSVIYTWRQINVGGILDESLHFWAVYYMTNTQALKSLLVSYAYVRHGLKPHENIKADSLVDYIAGKV